MCKTSEQQVGDKAVDKLRDKVGEKGETKWATQRETKIDKVGGYRKQSGEMVQTRFQGSPNPGHAWGSREVEIPHH